MSLQRFFSNCAAALSISTLLLLLGGQSAYGEDHHGHKGQYIAIDFHQHTTYTDGSNPIATVMSKNEEFGLDWWANSEHGGVRSTDGFGPILAGPPSEPLRYPGVSPGTGTNFSVSGRHHSRRRKGVGRPPSACGAGNRSATSRSWTCWPRGRIYDRPIVQGLEWNVPGHEHCSTGIIGDQFDETARTPARWPISTICSTPATPTRQGAWRRAGGSGLRRT